MYKGQVINNKKVTKAYTISLCVRNTITVDIKDDHTIHLKTIIVQYK